MLIAKVLDRLGFNVDVVHFLYRGSLTFDKYDVVFGFGFPYEQSFFSTTRPIRIHYATGAQSFQRNVAEIKRIRDIWQRRGVILKPRRVKGYPDLMSSLLSDAIFVVGNQWTSSTYRQIGYDGPIYEIPVSILDYVSSSTKEREWDDAHKHFLWIGTYGLAHKGVDLLIEAFSECPDRFLHLVGPLPSNKEKDFVDLYDEWIDSSPNINRYGHLDVFSDRFLEIAYRCGYIISLSCSEGQSGSVLTGMMAGLIPLVTPETGVDIQDNGYYIHDTSIEGIKRTVMSMEDLESSEMVEMSRKNRHYVQAEHSQDVYFQNIERSLTTLLRNTQRQVRQGE
ncbi:MAG: hypothetical protein ABEL51_12610 [Salinibacter sp.]